MRVSCYQVEPSRNLMNCSNVTKIFYYSVCLQFCSCSSHWRSFVLFVMWWTPCPFSQPCNPVQSPRALRQRCRPLRVLETNASRSLVTQLIMHSLYAPNLVRFHPFSLRSGTDERTVPSPGHPPPFKSWRPLLTQLTSLQPTPEL